MATKFQQGGQDDQELFSAYLIKLFKPKSQQEFEDTISKLSEREINEIYKQYKSMENNQTIMAKMGAKINYISRLQGKCPEGYEVEGKQWLKAVKLWMYSKINVEVKPRDASRRTRMVIK